MTDNRSEEADLTAIKARCALNYIIASQPKFARNPRVIAAVADAKASEAALDAAVAEADAEPWFRMYGAYRHVLDVCAELDKSHAALRAAFEYAETGAASDAA